MKTASRRARFELFSREQSVHDGPGIPGGTQRSFDDTLELIANLIYLSRHELPGTTRQADYLDRAVEVITSNRNSKGRLIKEAASERPDG